MDTKTLNIKNYKRFFIGADTTASAKDTKTEYGLVAKSNPYNLLPNPKAAYSNDWKDQNGNDEYLTHRYFEPIEFSVDFYLAVEPTTGANPKTAAENLRDAMRTFFDNIKEGTFLVFDEYTSIGFSEVHYVGYEQDKVYINDGGASALFKIKFKTNAPTVKVKMQNGKIVTL